MTKAKHIIPGEFIYTQAFYSYQFLNVTEIFVARAILFKDQLKVTSYFTLEESIYVIIHNRGHTSFDEFDQEEENDGILNMVQFS